MAAAAPTRRSRRQASAALVHSRARGCRRVELGGWRRGSSRAVTSGMRSGLPLPFAAKRGMPPARSPRPRSWSRITAIRFVIASTAKHSRAGPGRPGMLRCARNDALGRICGHPVSGDDRTYAATSWPDHAPGLRSRKRDYEKRAGGSLRRPLFSGSAGSGKATAWTSDVSGGVAASTPADLISCPGQLSLPRSEIRSPCRPCRRRASPASRACRPAARPRWLPW